MKLIAASTLALAATYSAQSIESLIGQLINDIYQYDPEANTHTFNVAPYFQAVYTCKGNGFTSEGTVGNGNGVFDFSEEAEWTDTSFEYGWEASGKTKSHPLVSLLDIPENFWEDKMSQEGLFKISTEGIEWNMGGAISGNDYQQSISLSLDEMRVTQSKYSAKVSFQRSAKISSDINEFYHLFLMPTGNTNVNLVLGAKKVCGENPFNKKCTAKITVTGNNDELEFGENVAKYSVNNKKAQFQIKHDNVEVFWMGLFGIDSLDVLSLKYKINRGKAVLVVQVVGPAGFESVVEAALEFAGPFESFFGKIESFDDTAHIAVWFDKVVESEDFDTDLFNVYPVIKATKFESDLLVTVLGSSFQKWAEKTSEGAAKMIFGAAEDVSPLVSDARKYVNNLTGPVGEQKFDEWFARMNKNDE